MKDFWEQIKYFKPKEVMCPDGCGSVNVAESHMILLDTMREEEGAPPMRHNSCVRCDAHNKAVGGSPTSSHKTTDEKPCFASDIHAPDGITKFKLVRAAIAVGMRQIGVYKNFVHLGSDPAKPMVVFRGKY